MGNQTSSVKGSRLEQRVFESFQLLEELVDKLEFANTISRSRISPVARAWVSCCINNW